MIWTQLGMAATGALLLLNAALPIVTVTGLQFGLLLGGAVLTETVFAVPGVGRLIVNHEEIKGFMAAMEMSYPVAPPSLLFPIWPPGVSMKSPSPT